MILKCISRWRQRRDGRRRGIICKGNIEGLRCLQLEDGRLQLLDGCNFSGRIMIGKNTTLGYRNFLHGTVTVGRYCQLGSDVGMFAISHPTTRLSTYINSQLFPDLKSGVEDNPIEIGNDVWIGHRAVILGGTKIGNGAIVGASSVVTKDVPDYAIAVGNPAKVIKYRFPESLISELLALSWWNKSDTELQEMKSLFMVSLQDQAQLPSVTQTVVNAPKSNSN